MIAPLPLKLIETCQTAKMSQKLCEELLTAIFDACLTGSSSVTSANSHFNLANRRSASPQGTLCSAARVCRAWNNAATSMLYYDPGPPISRYEGLYLPLLLSSLRNNPLLRKSVRSLTITASLEAGLWISDFACEGESHASSITVRYL